MTNKKSLKLDIKDRVAHIILDSPPDNRMDKNFFIEFNNIFDQIRDNKDIGVAVIYGNGRHFSAGADIEGVKNGIQTFFEKCHDIDHVVEGCIANTVGRYLEMGRLRFPIIAAINGFCIGAGLELALACDIRICSAEAIFGVPELSWGIITGCNGSIRLEKLVGKAHANEMMLEGSFIDGLEACKIGLVNRVTERDQAVSYALNLAHTLARSNRRFVNFFLKDIIAYA